VRTAWSRDSVFAVRLLVRKAHGEQHIRQVQLITPQGYVVGTVAWDSERHWPIERLCRDTGLALQVVNEVDAPMLVPYGHELAVPLAPAPPVRWQAAPEQPPMLVLSRDRVTVRDPFDNERSWPRLGSGDPREPLVSRLCGYRRPLSLALTPEQRYKLLTTGFVPRIPHLPVIGVALVDPDNRMLCLVQCGGWLGPELEAACARVGIALDEQRHDDPLTEDDAPLGASFVPVSSSQDPHR
jgi:hypothetical protein